MSARSHNIATRSAERAGAIRRPAAWRADLGWALTAALLAAALLAIGFNYAWPLTIDFGAGARDTRFAEGFYEPEQFGPDLARWTSGAATIALPQLPANAPATLELRLPQGRPAGQPDAHVALSAAGQPLGEFDAATGSREARIYRALLPANQRLGWATRVDIHADTFTPPGDPRALGVVVDKVTVVPSGGWRLPSLWLLAVSAGIGALGYGLLRGVGAGRAAAWVAIGCVGALLAWSVAWRPLEVCRSSSVWPSCWAWAWRAWGWRECWRFRQRRPTTDGRRPTNLRPALACRRSSIVATFRAPTSRSTSRSPGGSARSSRR